jgi:hypothetical protein
MKLRVAAAGLALAVFALAPAPTSSGADSPAPPGEFQALYDELSQKLTSFEAGVDADWDGTVGDGQNPPNDARFDLNASGGVNLGDIVVMGPFFNRSCAA